MTHNLSQAHPIITDRGFPDACPKCGAAFGARRMLPTEVRTHFERHHPRSIGTARVDGRELFDFAFVAPVLQVTQRRWHVVAFSWPFGLVTIVPDEWDIVWLAGTVPAEGVFG